jgi:hypothetical protein
MKKLQQLTAAFLLMISLVATSVFIAPTASAVDPREQACIGAGGKWTPAAPPAPAKCSSGTAGTNELSPIIKSIVNVLLFVIGAAAVIMIIIGGMRYVLSGGDAAGTKGAKDTIIYAIIGLIVAFLAYALVNFVLTSF